MKGRLFHVHVYKNYYTSVWDMGIYATCRCGKRVFMKHPEFNKTDKLPRDIQPNFVDN